MAARKLISAGLLGAAAAAAPEDAEAGLLNTGISALRRSANVDSRSLKQERGDNRGQRNVSNVGALSAAEKAAIRKSIKGKGVNEVAAFNVVKEWKKRHPKSDWLIPEITGVDVGSKGEIKVKTKNQKYNFNIDPKTKKQAERGSAHYNKIVNNVANEIIEISKRAQAGDPSAQRVMDNAGWYKNVESRLRTEYGSFSGMMGDILGATSPNTPVGTNFKFSQDILARATSGEFDQVMDGFADALDRRYELQDQAAGYLDAQKAAGRTKKAAMQDPQYMALENEAKDISQRLQAEENTIKQSTFDPKTGKPKNYGINSYNSMIALADRWRVLRPGGAPKARNFSGNLSGRSEQATIDVWAARNLRRHSGLKPIPSSAESAVTGNIVDAENFRNSLEFGFGQDVLADATVRINNELGMDLNPRDLQALQWFAEKDHWTQRGWTSSAGEGGSFETMMDQDPVSSMFLGISREQNQAFQGNDFIPTPAQSDATAKQIVGAGGVDPDIRAVKGMPTIGQYDAPETAMDIDVVSSQDQIPTSILDAAAKQVVKDKQDSWFIANRVDPAIGQNNPSGFNIGSEVYFKDGVSADSKVLKDIQADLSDQGVPGYTMIVDPRNADRVVGVRFLDIPQFYDPEKFARMSPEQYGQHATQTLGAYNEIGERLKSKFPQVQSASPGYFDVNVKSGRQTEDYVAQLQGSQRDPDALHQEFYGYRPATQRFKEYTGENQPYYFQNGDGPPPAPAGATGQQGFASPAALAATAATGAGLLGASQLMQPQGGMGVRPAPAGQDEQEFISAQPPTAAPNSGLLGPGQNDYGLNLNNVIGMADAGVNAAAGMIAPVLSAPGAVARYAADRYIPGVNFSADDMANARKNTESFFDYQPKTQQGQQFSNQGMQALGGLLGPVANAADDSYIINAFKKGFGLLDRKEQELLKALTDMSPI